LPLILFNQKSVEKKKKMKHVQNLTKNNSELIKCGLVNSGMPRTRRSKDLCKEKKTFRTVLFIPFRETKLFCAGAFFS